MSKGLQIAIALELIYFLVKCTEKNGNIPIGIPLTFEILFLKNHINNGKQINIIF